MNSIYATCDPGVNTSIILWKDRDILQIEYFRSNDLLKAVEKFYTTILCLPKIEKMIIEGVDYRKSLKGEISASRGNIVKLSYYVGGYTTVSNFVFKIPTEIIKFNTWGGTMDEKKIRYRVERAIGVKFKNIHIYCAVGIGLHLQGRL